jgi:hypothetical protein
MNGNSLLNWGFLICAGSSYVLIVLFVSYLFKANLIKVSVVLFSLLFLFANILHYRYYENPIVFGSFYSLKNIPFVWGYILDLLEVNDLFFALGTVLLSLMLFRDKGVPSIKFLMPIFFLALFLTGVRFYGCTVSAYQDNGDLRQSLDVTLFHLHKRNMVTLGFGFAPPLVVEAYQFFMSDQVFGPTPEYELNLEPNSWKPNIILVQVESLPLEIIGKKYRGKEATPFLNSLTKEAAYFTNIFPQHTPGGGTSDADFSTLTSLLPKRGMPSLYAKGLEKLVSLPKILRSAGYTTVAFHANTGGFYGRAFGYEKLGFDHYYSKKELPAPPEDTIVLPDGHMFDYAISKMSNFDKPFFAFLVTISSHGPYDTQEFLPLQYRTKTEAGNGDELNNYIKMIHYVDSSLERFVNKLESKFKDNIIVIYGDHPPLLESLGLKGQERVPLIVMSGKQPGGLVDSTRGSHYDIPVIVLSQLGLDRPSNWLGEDHLKYKPKRSEGDLSSRWSESTIVQEY